MLKNEEDAKIKIVLRLLEDLGFQKDELLFERSFNLRVGRCVYRVDTGEQVNRLAPRLDILVTRNGRNVCVVEVKNPGMPLTQEDEEQAVSYGRLVHPIVPFCIVTNGKDHFFVDTVSRKRLEPSELRLDGYSVRLETESYYEAIQHFLGYSTDNLLYFCHWLVRSNLECLKGSAEDRDKNYVPALYHPPKRLEDACSEFMRSDSRVFALVADSGMGKTCWACYKAEELLRSGYPVLFYRAVDIASGGLVHALARDLCWELPFAYSEIESSKRFFEAVADHTLTIILDGLDEIDATDARRLMDDLIRRTAGRPVKTVITCKPVNWHSLLEHDGIPTRLAERVHRVDSHKGFFLRELEPRDLHRMIDKYRDFYEFHGLFEDKVLHDCLRSPFLLRLMFEVASKSDSPHITYAVQDFYARYIKKTLNRFPLAEREAIDTVLTQIAGRLFATNKDFIESQILREMLGLSLTQSLPLKLFELCILSKVERGGLSYVGFYFSKIRDYFIAFKYLRLQHLSTDALLAEITGLKSEGCQMEALSLYFTLCGDEHKRALAGEAYDKAKLYVEHYQGILDTDFPALKERFPPYTKGEIGFVGMIDLSTRRIGTYGFCPKAHDAKVRLIPKPSFGGIRDTNLPYLEGATRLKYRPSTNGFVDIRVIREVIRGEILPTLDEVTKNGSLKEDQCRYLLEELVAASYMEYYDKKPIKWYEEPQDRVLRLSDIRYYVLYDRALRVYRDGLIDAKRRRGEGEEYWDADIHVFRPHWTDEDDRVIQDQAKMDAESGIFAENGMIYKKLDSRDKVLLDALDALDSLGLIELTIPSQNFHRRLALFQSSEPDFEFLKHEVIGVYHRFLHEYKQIVHSNFPTMASKLPLYKMMPVKCFLSVTPVRGFHKQDFWLTVVICRDDPGTENSVVFCESPDYKLDIPAMHLRHEGKSYAVITVGDVDLWSVLFPYRAYTPFKVRREICSVRSLVYQRLRQDLNDALFEWAKLQGVADVHETSRPFWP